MITFKLDYSYFRLEALRATGRYPLKSDVQLMIKFITDEYHCHIEEHVNYNSWSIDFYGKCSEEDFIIFKLKHPDAILGTHDQTHINPNKYLT